MRSTLDWNSTSYVSPVLVAPSERTNLSLMICNDEKQMIALFTGPAQAGHPVRGHRRLAFRVNADEFAQFIQDSVRWSDPPLGTESIQDHGRAISVYFPDPFGNPLEVTTYDYKNAKAFVNSLASSNVSDS